MRVFMVTAGLLLVIYAARFRARARTPTIRLYLASLICGGLGLIIWVPDDSLALDRLLHTPGVGHLFTIWLITLCFTLQYAFVITLTARWTALHRWGFALYGVCLLAFTVAWLFVHLSLRTRFPTLSYGQYQAGPPAVLAMDLAGSACIILAGLLGAWGYRRILVAGGRIDERLGASAATSVFVGAVAYGGLAFAQTLANTGGASLGIFAARIPIILFSAAVAPLAIWSITYLHPFWRRVRVPAGYEAALADLQEREERLRQQMEEQYQLRLDLLDAQTTIDDAIARLQHFADPAVVEEVAACSARRNLTPYQRRVAIEAAIWTTAMRNQAPWIPWVGVRGVAMVDEARDPQQLHAQVEQAHVFTADTFRVVLLALGARQLPEGMAGRTEPPGWRRRAAAMLRYALRTHGYDRASLLAHHTH